MLDQGPADPFLGWTQGHTLDVRLLAQILSMDTRIYDYLTRSWIV